ncbi:MULTISPECIES: GMC family oxidoreductase [Streptomyces]|uniref:GMC family oxidoreductase n=1 Tax=Streptomyces TaxID=1883 RepID=UPI00078299C2|nr:MULTISPECIES: GMC family oxidoreductase N-terminal domain-containing protein [Streptomyces]MBW8094041.1 GMC family oxidoreductase N-terminal domain-containing protein [Streptomyces hygroscopicus subsp. hygroscopicus]MCO8305247.1 GMC family oxidoreductase N-terminal domain-containing protein [Streptomyces sp. RKCA744]
MDERRPNQAAVETEYDVIVCGAGSAGSTVAGLLAADTDLRVLLIEAGPDDDDARVSDPDLWPLNLGSERDWGYVAAPGAGVDGRRVPYSMGKGLGGGSSINVGVWSRGHRRDWDDFAETCADPRWNYASALTAYRDLETWAGDPDPARRGTAGPMHVRPSQPLHPFFAAMLDGAEAAGLARYAGPNGELAEQGSGCAVRDEIVSAGVRRSPYRAFVAPRRGQRNLTVLTQTQVVRVVIEGDRATGVEVVADGRAIRFRAVREVVLSLGAVQTPKILMQSGIGPARHLEALGIGVRADLPGVGANLDDHLLIGCVWEAGDRELPPPSHAQAVCFWGDDGRGQSPKFVMYSGADAFMSPEAQSRYGRPESAFTFLLGMRLRSRGSVRLASPDPRSAPVIETGYLTDPEDLRDAVEAYRFAESIAGAEAMRPWRGPRAIPAGASDGEVSAYIRTAASTFWHQCGTARVGVDAQAVVDSELRVRGLRNLRVADASVLPRVTSGNTMAPCVLIGYRAAGFIRG